MEDFLKARLKTVLAINLTGVFEKADESILPAMYKYVSVDLKASLSQMGLISVCRSMTQAVTSPIGGIMGTLMNRVKVIVIGCLIWSVMTLMFGTASWMPHPFIFAAIFWSFNGLGLSLVIPNAQSIIADFYTDTTRGKAFGILYMTGAIGAIIGSLYAANIAGNFSYGNIKGWQWVMFSFAAFSLGVGILTNWFAKDPNDAKLIVSIGQLSDNKEITESLFILEKPEISSIYNSKSRVENYKIIIGAIKYVFGIWSFRIIILQGIVGSMPWKALAAYTILYFQLIGMTDFQASFIYSAFLMGYAFGIVFGGWVGDMAAERYPSHGRIFVCQFSVFVGIPLTFLIFRIMPMYNTLGTIIAYTTVMLMYGVLISWAASACNSPIFAEIVPPDTRTIIYAFDRCLEDALSSPVTYFVGLAAEKIWGFSGEATATGIRELDIPRALALKDSILWFSVIPWTLCFLVYTGLHYTYPKDKIVTDKNKIKILDAEYQHL